MTGCRASTTGQRPTGSATTSVFTALQQTAALLSFTAHPQGLDTVNKPEVSHPQVLDTVNKPEAYGLGHVQATPFKQSTKG